MTNLHEEEEDECPHGLGMKAACTICNGRDKKASTTGVEYTFVAKYPGRCDWCSTRLSIGDTINMMKTGLKMCDPCATEVG